MKVILAGATGYLGGYIYKELRKRNYDVKVVARKPEKLGGKNIRPEELLRAEVTKAESIKGCCEGCDAVITTVGITRQRDGLTYMDVDYGANLNLLNEALESGVKKFIYVSVFKGEELRSLKICEAKEKFVDRLKESGLNYCVIRPNGFFSDMTEFYSMAKSGRVYVLGSGEQKTNPIHGEDLAIVCVDALDKNEKVIEAGGPEILSQNEVALAAFEAAGNKPKIVHIPGWMTKIILGTARVFTSSKIYGPVEFFLTAGYMNLVAPKYGNHTLINYYKELNAKGN